MADERNPAERSFDQGFTLRRYVAVGIVAALVVGLVNDVSASVFVFLVLICVVVSAATWRFTRFMIDLGRRK